MSVYTQVQINQLASLSTTEILARFQVPVSIQVVRSERTNTPIIVFHSTSGILCNVLARKHSNLLAVMQPDWTPWVGNAAKDKEGEYFSTIALKGLKPSTLRAWVSKARSAGFIVDDQVLSPTIRAEVTSEATTTVAAEVVEAIPVEARPVAAPVYPQLNPIQARVMSLTVKEMKQYLKDIGEKTSGNKAVLRERVMASI
jgi:hypothetical protein